MMMFSRQEFDKTDGCCIVVVDLCRHRDYFVRADFYAFHGCYTHVTV